MKNRDQILQWLERGLLSVGIALAAWCAFVLVEARFTANMPVPPLTITQSLPQSLPGDANGARNHLSSAPAPGTWLARLEAPTVQMTATVLEGSDDGTLRRGAGFLGTARTRRLDAKRENYCTKFMWSLPIR